MPFLFKPKSRKKRAPRARLPHNEPAFIVVERRKLAGTLLTLSSTGGAIRLSTLVPRGSLGEIMVQTGTGKVRAVIEFLGKGADGVPTAQAFRFISIEPSDRERLAQAMHTLLERGYGVERRQWVVVFLLRLARRLTKAG